MRLYNILVLNNFIKIFQSQALLIYYLTLGWVVFNNVLLQSVQ